MTTDPKARRLSRRIEKIEGELARRAESTAERHARALGHPREPKTPPTRPTTGGAQ